MFKRRASLAVRIALASALFGLLILGTGMVVGYWTLSRQLDARSIAVLETKRNLVLHLLSETPSVQALTASRHRFQDVLIGHDDLHLAFVDAGWKALETFSAAASESVAVMERLNAPGQPHPWVSREGKRLVSLRVAAPLGNGAPVHFYLSLDRKQDAQLLAGFLRASLLGTPVLLAVVALGAWLIARTALAPLRRFHRMAASIGAGSLNRRVSEAGLPGDLSELAQEFNGMLQRIDSAYRRLQEFSADLAHELRTPVATLLGRNQVTLSMNRSAAEMREVLEGDIEELERLSRLIADMLFIAQAEQGAGLLQRERLQLAEEAARIAEYLSALAQDKDIQFQVTGVATADGERLLVQRAITNLLTNAVRHADSGTAVLVRVSEYPDSATLEVVNKGELIPAEHLDRVFDRFARLDPSRARGSGGTGLDWL